MAGKIDTEPEFRTVPRPGSIGAEKSPYFVGKTGLNGGMYTGTEPDGPLITADLPSCGGCARPYRSNTTGKP